jgi:hypothetical protein
MPSHKWDHDKARFIAAHESPDGNGRHERTCIVCQMTKITIIPPRGLGGFPWHQWRTKDGDIWTGEATPPCLVAKPVEVRAA